MEVVFEKKLPQNCDAKITEIFLGQQMRELIKDKRFEGWLNNFEKHV